MKLGQFHVLGSRKALARFFVGKDGGTSGVELRVAVGMIEVPVGVDEVPERRRIEPANCLKDARRRELATPLSMTTFPSLPVRMRMFPPAPESIDTLPEVLLTWMGPDICLRIWSMRWESSCESNRTGRALETGAAPSSGEEDFRKARRLGTRLGTKLIMVS
jgi:hypothetical protein